MPHAPTQHLPPPLQKLLEPLLSQEPAAQLIRSTARQQWRLLAVNLLSSVLEALSEGATLAVVFLAVEVLTAPEATSHLLSWWPAATSWLNALPPTALFICLLALAVLLQALQSLGRFANTVSVGTFTAECRARVTARIHSQVLRFSFPCASGTKVGDLTDYASQLLLAVALVGAAGATGANPDWLPPEPPGAPARTKHSAACRQQGSRSTKPRTSCSQPAKQLGFTLK